MKEPFETYDRWVREFYIIIERPLPEFGIYLVAPERIEIVLEGARERDVAYALNRIIPFYLPLLELPGVHYEVVVYAVPARFDVHSDVSDYDE